jgi:Leucine-rich repeat (LRR) protein
MKFLSVLSALLVIVNVSRTSETISHCEKSTTNLKCTNQKQQTVEFSFEGQQQFNWNDIKDLRLTKNRITSLKKGIFTQFINVEKMHLDDNELSKIDFNEFGSNSKLTDLDVGFNNIADIQPIQQSLGIINLEIHNNDLTDILELCNLKKLKMLNLSRNRKLDVSNVMFNCWSELTHLFLVETNLKSLNHDYHILIDCKKLEYLNLMDNELGMICLQRFPELSGLKYFNIRNNSLTNLDVHGLKQKFQNLEHITTTGNKWSCNYHQNMTNWMKQQKLQEYPNYVPAYEKNCSESANNDESGAVETCPEINDDEKTKTNDNSNVNDKSNGNGYSNNNDLRNSNDKSNDTESNNSLNNPHLANTFWIIFFLSLALCIIVLVLLKYYIL